MNLFRKWFSKRKSAASSYNCDALCNRTRAGRTDNYCMIAPCAGDELDGESVSGGGS